MIEFLKKQYLAVKRAVFTETGPDSFKRKRGEPKFLKPQATRLQQELNSRRLRHHYLTGQLCMLAAFLLWLVIPALPSTSHLLDMHALQLCLYIIALMAFLVGLFQAWAMSRAVVQIEQI
ncbi:hypothetical protein BC777_2353 [Yoonia maricola]|uniref:Uncharacterized protein n=1 Tax=Yoonia maricola TaxID=420999 RepID=A0A2M8W519_9RHOB|nr:hypothetical protein [Yoonia maricola]PJI85999.1 hypothetical protein BC777_2353 [Yoonia maricola]